MMGRDGVKGPAPRPPTPARQECNGSVAGLLPFLLPLISLSINSVTDVATFPSLMLLVVLSSGPLQARRVNAPLHLFGGPSSKSLMIRVVTPIVFLHESGCYKENRSYEG
jgi:hypothetical protein